MKIFVSSKEMTKTNDGALKTNAFAYNQSDSEFFLQAIQNRNVRSANRFLNASRAGDASCFHLQCVQLIKKTSRLNFVIFDFERSLGSCISFCDWLEGIYRAKEENCSEILDLLFNYEKFVHGRTKDGWTALHLAVLNCVRQMKPRELEKVEILLESGRFDINALTDELETVFHFACRSVPTKNFLDEFEMTRQKFCLLEVNGDQKNFPLQAPLMFECTKSCVTGFHESIISDFLNGYKLDIIDRDNDGKTALVLTKQSNAADIVATMDEKLLLTAVKKGDWNTVKIHLNAADDALKRQRKQVSDYKDQAYSLPKVVFSENSISASVWLEAVWIAYSQAYQKILRQLIKSLRSSRFRSTHLYDSDTNFFRIETLIEMLLKHGVRPNVGNNKGETALMLARDENIVNSLLKLTKNHPGIHLDVDTIDNSGETAIMKAERRGDAKIAAALLGSKLFSAIENEDKIFVRALMDKYMKTRIVVLDSDNYTETQITEHGFNFTSWTDAARLAMQKSSKEMLNILLKDDFIVKSQECENGDPILHRLFKDEEENKPLIEFLLESGELNVNAINFDGETALISRYWCHKDINPLLLQYGADVNLRNKNGETLLMMASAIGDSSDVQTILNWTREKGVWWDLNARDRNGQTALIRAVTGKHTDVVALLLNAGASVNLPDHRGFTPLHHALCEAFITDLWLRFDSYPNGFYKWIDFGDFPRDFEKLQKMRVTIFTLLEAERSKVNEDMLKIIELLLEREDLDANALQCNGFSPLDIVEASIAEIPLSIRDALEKKGAVLNVYRHANTPSTTKSEPISNSDIDVTCSNFILHRLAIADVGFKRLSEKKKGFELLREGFHKLSETVKNEMVSTKDRKGRTPLHSAVISCEKIFPILGEYHMNIMRLLISFGCKVNETDIYGRTPLHYANNERLQKLLLSYGAVASIKDRNGISAIETFPETYSADYSYDDMSIIESAVERIGKICSLRQHKDRTDLQRYCGNVDRNKSIPWCEHLNPKTVFERVWKVGKYACRYPATDEITEKVKKIVDDLVNEIKIKDSRFEVKPVLVGSAYEGTKIGLPNEFDFNLRLTKFSELCEVYSSPELPPGYVRLRRKQTKVEAAKESEFEDFFTDGGILITEKVKEQFYMVLANVVTYIDSQRNYEWDWNFSFQGWPNQSIVCDRLKPVITLYLKKMKFDPIDKNTVKQISVDIVPCIRIDGWWPDEAITNVSDDIKAVGCHLIFDHLQRLYPWVPYSESYARISFAPVESEMIRRSRNSAKQAYMIGKQFIKYERCKTSYFLKNSLLYCNEALARNPEIFNKSDDLLLESLMKCHLEFVKRDFCPHYFMPAFCLPNKLYMEWISEGDSGYPGACLSAYRLYCITSMDYSTSYMQSLPPNFIFENFEPMAIIKQPCDSASEQLIECYSWNCDEFRGRESRMSKGIGECEHRSNSEIMKMLCKDDFTSFESFDIHEAIK